MGSRRAGVLPFAVFTAAASLSSLMTSAAGATDRVGTVGQSTLLPGPGTVADGVHVLGGLSPSVAYVVETDGGLIVIDTGADPRATSLLRQIVDLGLDPADVRLILLTHAHLDHVAGAMRLRRAGGAEIGAGRGDSELLRRGAPLRALTSVFDEPSGVWVEPIEVDLELDDGDVVGVGGTRITVVTAPGHTPGSVCYLLERGGHRLLFSGDVIMSRTFGPGTYSTYIAPVYRGDAKDYLGTLRKLLALTPPDLLLPGHPMQDREPQGAGIDPRRWRELLEPRLLDMQQLVAHYASGDADFLDGTAKEILPGLHYLGDFARRAVYALAASEGVFVFDAPGGPGLVGFLRARLAEAGLAALPVTAVLLTSCDAEATAGLSALVEATGCRVVTPRLGLAEVARRVPAASLVEAESELQPAGWLPVRPLPLAGRGSAPIAYLLQWEGKRVLVPGRLPSRLGFTWHERGQARPFRLLSRAALHELRDSLAGPDADARAYVGALRLLAREQPDLWLPARPFRGQNATLWPGEWRETLESNIRAVDAWLGQSR